MRIISVIVITVVGVCSSLPVFSQIRGGFKDLEAHLFMDKILEENNHLLIDVRPEEDFQKNRISGAINAPNSEVMNSILDTIDQERPVLLYCLYGQRSKMAAVKILEKYSLSLYHLEGGIRAWEKARFELDKKRIRKKKG
ncbi:MAG: rhodanese-like domain-containing protein [Marinifilaceae bacterium]